MYAQVQTTRSPNIIRPVEVAFIPTLTWGEGRTRGMGDTPLLTDHELNFGWILGHSHYRWRWLPSSQQLLQDIFEFLFEQICHKNKVVGSKVLGLTKLHPLQIFELFRLFWGEIKHLRILFLLHNVSDLLTFVEHPEEALLFRQEPLLQSWHTPHVRTGTNYKEPEYYQTIKWVCCEKKKKERELLQNYTMQTIQTQTMSTKMYATK